MNNSNNSIPKTIHFCWFSGDPFPVEVKECIDSWKKILPDFQLRHWTYEDAKSVGIPFVDDALAARKWAFAADVVRLHAVYTEGGVYMDTDILLLKRFDEFMGSSFSSFHECFGKEPILEPNIDFEIIEEDTHNMGIQAAFFMGVKGNAFCASLLDKYKSLDYTTQVLAPHVYAEGARDFGYKYINAKQTLRDDTVIHPSCYMAPNRKSRTLDSFAVHRCEHSWYEFSLKQRVSRKVRRFFKGVSFYSKGLFQGGNV